MNKGDFTNCFGLGSIGTPASIRALSVLVILLVPRQLDAAITSFIMKTDVGIADGKFRISTAPAPNGTVYAFNVFSTHIEVFDGATGVLDRTADIGRRLYAGTVVGDYLYAIGRGDRTSIGIVSVIDLTTAMEAASIPFDESGGNGSVEGDIIASPNRDRVYGILSNTLVAVDTATGKLIDSVYFGNASGSDYTGLAVSPDGSRVYVVERLTGIMQIVDAKDLSIVDTTSFLEGHEIFPYRVAAAVHPTSGNVYVGYTDASSVAFQIGVLDANGSILKTFKTSTRASTGLGISPDGSLLISGNGEIYSTLDGERIAKFASGSGTFDVSVSQDGSAYIANFNSNYITAIKGLPVPEPDTARSVAILVAMTASAAIKRRSARGC